MKKVHILGAVLLGVVGVSGLSVTAVQAQDYPVCLQGTDSTRCEFDTYAQCRASASGVGGSCIDNPLYRGPSATRAPSPMPGQTTRQRRRAQ
jgi:hypothetical protein